MSTSLSTGVQTVVYPVRDLDAATTVLTALCGQPHTQSPYYVGFSLGDQQIGLDPHGAAQGLTGAVPYFHVPDLAASLSGLVAAGASVLQDAKDVGGGRLVATLTDPDGNLVGLLQDPE